MQDLRVGHYSNTQQSTGVTVFLFDKPAQGVYQLCGSAPATHELHTLELEASVTHVDGLALMGGSTYGLFAAEGVVRWFREQGRGVPTAFGAIPIVPAAAIFDLGVGKAVPPSADEAYLACQSARVDEMSQGRIGAGTGASVGKLLPDAQRMSGGLGYAEIKLPDGLSVIAYAVVNSVGDIRDDQGNIIAGARLQNGEFADTQRSLMTSQNTKNLLSSNTTLVAIFTNALLSKAELKRIAKMAVAGMARAISPVFTEYDGDLLFCFSIGKQVASELTVGVIAVEAVRQSIVNAVKN